MQEIFVIVPTFREPEKVRLLLDCFLLVRPKNVTVLIANGNFQDSTSEIISNAGKIIRVRELQGNPSLFWSGLTNLGIRFALQEGSADDFIVLMNADTSFSYDVFTKLRAVAIRLGPCQLGALTHVREVVISSGVAIKSWALALNRHPFAGKMLSEVPENCEVGVDFLPGRCTLIPLTAVHQAGEINENLLPHYGADYEFTARLKRAGFAAYIYTGAQVACDVCNTGYNNYHKKLPLLSRLQGLFSLKAAYNPFYRTRFIWATYPLYACPSASIIYLLKTFVDVFCSGAMIRTMIPMNETGFAGSSSVGEGR